MLKVRSAFASFSTNDIDAAKAFYAGLGLEVRDTPMGVIEVMVDGDQHVTIYPKPNHEPASFTVLNFIVPDIDEAVDDLAAMGVEMEHYDMPGMERDGDIHRGGGMNVAWFKDPAGNILSVQNGPDQS